MLTMTNPTSSRQTAAEVSEQIAATEAQRVINNYIRTWCYNVIMREDRLADHVKHCMAGCSRGHGPRPVLGCLTGRVYAESARQAAVIRGKLMPLEIQETATQLTLF
jgi:hypothetical protein